MVQFTNIPKNMDENLYMKTLSKEYYMKKNFTICWNGINRKTVSIGKVLKKEINKCLLIIIL